jgi:hypothetical protein
MAAQSGPYLDFQAGKVIGFGEDVGADGAGCKTALRRIFNNEMDRGHDQ